MGLLAFALGGALGGLAGVLVTPVQQVTFDTDVTLIVNGFAAAILGGLTRPAVTLGGALLLGVAQTMVAGTATASHQTGGRAGSDARGHDRAGGPPTDHPPRRRHETARAGVARWSPPSRSRCPPLLATAQLAVYILLGLAAMVTVGLSLLMGYAGQVSLGQAPFYAIGAYTAGLLALHGVPPPARAARRPGRGGRVRAASIGIAAAAAARPPPGLRHAGHAADPAVAGRRSSTGPAARSGCRASRGFGVGSFEVGSDVGVRLPDLGGLALVAAGDAQRDHLPRRAGPCARWPPARPRPPPAASRSAATSSPSSRCRPRSPAWPAASTPSTLGYLAPGSFPVLLSIEYVVMAVVGGLGTIWGPVVGATAITLLVQGLNDSAPGPACRATRRPCSRTPSTLVASLVVALWSCSRRMSSICADWARSALARSASRTPSDAPQTLAIG